MGENVKIFTNYQRGVSLTATLGIKAKVQMLPVSNLCHMNKSSLDIIKNGKPDVVYFFGNPLSGVYLECFKCLKAPIVLHISSVHYSFSDLKTLSLKNAFSHRVHVITSLPPTIFLVRKLNSTVITLITVPSKAIKASLVRQGVSSERIRVAPLTFDAANSAIGGSAATLNIRKSLKLGKENFVATYLGSPNTVRGTDILLHSAKILRNKVRNLKILLLCRRDFKEDNKDEKLLFQLIKKSNLGNTVEIVRGTLTRYTVNSYLRASDIVVFPFKIVQSEPPLAVLEAMALGKPVITTKTCGLPELVNLDRGFLVEPGDANALADTIYYSMQNSEILVKLGRQAKDFISTLPSCKELGKWTNSVFCQAIQRTNKMAKSKRPGDISL